MPNVVIAIRPTVNQAKPVLTAATKPPSDAPASPPTIAVRRDRRSTSRPISGAAKPVIPVIAEGDAELGDRDIEPVGPRRR